MHNDAPNNGWVFFAVLVIGSIVAGFGYVASRRTTAAAHRVYNAHPIPFCVGSPCSAVIQTCSGAAPTVKNVEYTLVEETIVAGPMGPVLVCAWEGD